MAGPKTSAGKGVFQMAKVVADILRLVAKLRPPPVTSGAAGDARLYRLLDELDVLRRAVDANIGGKPVRLEQ